MYRSSSTVSSLKVNTIRALIFRESKFIASPVLQDKKGGDKKIPHLFREQFWVHSLDNTGEKPVLASLTLEEWKALATYWFQDTKRQERTVRIASTSNFVNCPKFK